MNNPTTSPVVVVKGDRERQQRLQRNIRLDDEEHLAKFYKLRLDFHNFSLLKYIKK